MTGLVNPNCVNYFNLIATQLGVEVMTKANQKDKNLRTRTVKATGDLDLKQQLVDDSPSIMPHDKQIECVEAVDLPRARIFNSVIKFLSIPERTVRSGLAITGGVIKESANFLIPQAFRSAKIYQVMVDQALNFVVNEIGGVERTQAEKDKIIDNFVARKTLGNLVETASIMTLHVSPLWILAALSDVAYGSKIYLRELSIELKAMGLIAEKSRIDDVDGLLEALGGVSGTAADAVNVPPLTMRCLKKSVADTRKALISVDPAEIISLKEIERLWGEIKSTAKKEDMSMLGVAGAMLMGTGNRIINIGKGALASTMVTLMLFDQHIIGHYQKSLTNIHKTGLFTSLQQTTRPYVTAVWENFNFHPDKETFTHKVMSGQLFTNAWRKAMTLFSSKRSVKKRTQARK